MATDLFSDSDGYIGENTLACEVDTGQTVAIGNLVYPSTHVAQSAPKISVAGASAANVMGVVTALDRGSGAATYVVTVLLRGRLAKLTASGAITVGNHLIAAASGKVAAGVTTVTIPSGTTAVLSTSAQPAITVSAGIAIGLALQTTTTDGDEFLALIY